MRNASSLGFGCLVIALFSGCALDVDSGSDRTADGRSGVKSDALAGFSHSFDDATQSVVFVPPSGTAWVDLHATIPGASPINVRMTFDGNVFRAGPLPVRAGDQVSYWFTYNTHGLSQNSAVFQHNQPAFEQPLALRAQVGASLDGYEIQVVSMTDLAWVDVHYTINNGLQQNVRMPSGDSLQRLPVALNPGDTLRYFITYSTGQFVFDSAWNEYRASAGRRFVVDLATDSSTGVCRADTSSGGKCNLRAAVAAARALGGAVSIELAVDPKIDQGEIAVAPPNETTGLHLSISTKAGSSAKAITGSANSKLFRVFPKATLSLNKLVIKNFSALDGGAAITNFGSLELRETTISGNKTFCSGVGAMTAFATCGGGAISSNGKMTVSAGSRFEQNSATAQAGTASFTNASAFGGAIASSGSLVVRAPIAFVSNASIANAFSGIHPMPGGAWANSTGGALYNAGGKLLIVGTGSCAFTSNAATAAASAPAPHSATASSRGGAIYTSGGTFQVSAACQYQNNTAQQDPEIASL